MLLTCITRVAPEIDPKAKKFFDVSDLVEKEKIGQREIDPTDFRNILLTVQVASKLFPFVQSNMLPPHLNANSNISY